MTRVLVTGASGFIGSALVAHLRGLGRSVTPAGRANWRDGLNGADAVVHLAGPAHVSLSDEAARAGIVDLTAALAEQAQAAGVRRFVYVSSIKACVDETTAPVNEKVEPRPATAYGRAKLEAETLVLARPALAPVVLRPPLVHDAAAKANMARLLRLLESDLPLPFAGLKQKRSVIALSSLLGAIVAVLDAPQGAGGGLFHVADAPSVTVARMAALLREGMGRAPRLFDAGPFSALAPGQLKESLEVDASAFRRAYSWSGADTEAALRVCGQDWAQAR